MLLYHENGRLKKTAEGKSEIETKRTRVAHGRSTEVTIRPEARVREFPDEPFQARLAAASLCV